MFGYLKTISIFAMLLNCYAFSTQFTNATGFEDLLPLRSRSITLNEGGFLFNNMKEICGIYKISSKTHPERIYIGSTINFIIRKRLHVSKLHRNIHENQKLQNHCNKYGIEDLSFELLELVMFKEDLIGKEQVYLDTQNPYFNICKTARSRLGVKLTKKTKQKMSKAKKGKTAYQMTDEIRKNMSKAQKGKTSWIKGKKHSEETIHKMREAAKNRKPVFLETRRRTRRVICLKTGVIFNSIINTASYYKIHPKSIWRMINGRRGNKHNLKYYNEKI